MAIGAALLGAALGTVSAAGGLTAVITAGFGAFAKGFLVRAAIGLALNALTPKPPSLGSANRGYLVTQKGSNLDHQIVYGTARVGPVILYDTTTDKSDLGSTGDPLDAIQNVFAGLTGGGGDNKYLHRVLGFAGHEIEDFEEIYINEKRVSILEENGNVKEVEGQDGEKSDRYDGKLRIIKALGSPDQEALEKLVRGVPQWTENHRLRNIAYLYATLEFDANVYPNGVPEITATVKGKKVYDPRSGTTAWSDNPALCVRDYLTSGYGLGEEDASIDDSLVSVAANVCDQTNTLDGSTRFTCNGSFLTSDTPYDLLGDLLTSMGGRLWYSQGKWRMKPAYWVEPTVTLTEDDLRGPISVSTRQSRRDNFNLVRGTFRGPESDWQPTDYPPVTNEAFVSADGGQEQPLDLALPFTDNSAEARRIARIALEENRQQITIQASFGLKAFQLQVGDTVKITNNRFGWDEKEFEVVLWTFGLAGDKDLQVQMSLKETSESVFDEVDDGIVYERDNTSILSAFDVPEVGLALSVELVTVNQEALGQITATLSSTDPTLDSFEVQYKKSSDTEYISQGVSSATTVKILFLEDDDYDVRARAINSFGIKGDWTTFSNFSARPFVEPPEDVANLSVNIVGSTANLSWDAVGDADLSHYRVKYNFQTSGATWSNSVDLVSKVARPATSVSVPALKGTYLIKAVDKLGYESNTASVVIISTDIRNLLDLNLIETIQEDPDFAGTTENTVVLAPGGVNNLILDSNGLFDDTPGLFDDRTGSFDQGSGLGVFSEGYYYFSDLIDLGAVYNSKVTSNLTMIVVDYANSFDDVSGLFDDREGLFDGDEDAFANVTAEVQVSTTNDDPSGTPTWSDYQGFVVSDLSARAYRFRAKLSTDSPDRTPSISALSVDLDMPERVQAENDISFTGTTTINFPQPFYTTSIPALGLTVSDLNTGDYYRVTSKTSEGFTLSVFDSTDTLITRSAEVDYVAKGFGKKIV